MASQNPDQALREISDLRELCFRLWKASYDAGLTQKRPFDPTPPNDDEIFYDPESLALARKIRASLSSSAPIR